RLELCRKTVASSSDSLDDFSRSVAGQRFAQQKDLLVEIAFFDDLFGPQALQQFIFAGDLIAVIDEIEQQVEGFAAQRDRLAVPVQLPAASVDRVTLEIEV